MLFKNVASQKVHVFAYDSTTGAAKTGDAANITAYVSLDGTANAVDDTNPAEVDATNMPGVYVFDLAQAETNCNAFALYAKSATANIKLDPIIGFTTGATALGVNVISQDNIDFGALQKASLNAATPASVVGAVGSVTAGVTVTTNNDKTGYTASTVSDKTGYALSSTGADLILKSSTFVQAIVAAINEFATYGLTALNTLLVTTGIKATSIPAATLVASQHVIVDSGTVTTLTNLPAVTADWLTAAGVKADAVTKIQNGLATPTNITAGTITTVTNLTNAPTNGDLTATMKSSVTSAVPTVAQIKTGVEAAGSHLALILEDTGTTIPGTIAALPTDADVNAACDTAISDAVLATAANLAIVDGNVDSILADTNELQTNQGNWLTATGFSTHSAADVKTAIEAAGSHLALILEDTGTTIPASIIDLPTDADVNAACDTAINDAALATAANLATVDTVVDSILEDTGTTLPTTLTNMSGATFDTLTDSLEALRNRGDAAWITATGFATPTNITAGTITTVTNLTNAPADMALDSTVAKEATVAALNNFDPAADTVAHVTLVDTTTTNTDMVAAAPSAATISDAVWDEALAGHADVGSTGAALSAAGGSGDPWATAIPGAYGAGTAGLLLGTTIPAAIDAIDNYIDTEIGALATAVADVPTVAEFEARTLVAADYVIVSDLGTVQTADHTATIADIPTVAEFNTRTLPAADYVVVADLGTVQTADHTTAIADIPTVAEFNARTLAAASYFDPAADTVAHVTLVDTTTTNTDMVSAAPSAASISDAVWDEALAGHADVGSTGAALSAAGGSGDPWSTALPGAYGAGTAGKIIGDNLNATVGSRSSHSAADVKTAIEAAGSHLTLIKTKTDSLSFTGTDVKATLDGEEVTPTSASKTGYSLAATTGLGNQTSNIMGNLSGSVGSVTGFNTNGSGLTSIPWNASWDTEVQSECTDALTAYDPPTKAELDLAVANVSVDEIQATALADLFNTDSGTTYAASVAGSVVKEIVDNAGGGGLTAEAIADQVWDEVLAGHAVAGTTGAALSAAGTAGDPWITTLPGAYAAGTAGYRVGHMLSLGAGAVSWPYVVTDSVTGDPIDGAEVWVSTDSDGTNVVASGTTDVIGTVTFLLDAATYYFWTKKSGYNFTNPDEEVVT